MCKTKIQTHKLKLKKKKKENGKIAMSPLNSFRKVFFSHLAFNTPKICGPNKRFFLKWKILTLVFVCVNV